MTEKILQKANGLHGAIFKLRRFKETLEDEKCSFSMTTTGSTPNSTYDVQKDLTEEIRALLPDAIQIRINKLEEEFKNL